MTNKITPFLLDEDVKKDILDNCEISIFAKPNAIPRTNEAGVLDSSWGTGGGGTGGGDMDRSTYDSNSDGKVNAADVTDRISGTLVANRFWGTSETAVQQWIDLSLIYMNKSIYDTNNDGKVNAAEVADLLIGNPSANMLWGTNENGIQGWQLSSNGNMIKSIYDSNDDGKVNAADVADRLSGTTTPNRVWGTDTSGVQTWLNFNSNSFMTKVSYDSQNTGYKVDIANKAESLLGEDIAPINSVYGKKSDGSLGFFLLGDISVSSMDKQIYDSNDDGKVNAADVADSLSTESSALNSTVYGKSSSGVIGFHPLSTLNPNIMLSTTYDNDNDGIVDIAKEAINLQGSSTALNATVFGKNTSGIFGFHQISSLDASLMRTSVYDTNNDGKVNSADRADSISTAPSAPNGTMYGKSNAGSIGFHSLTSFEPNLMTSNIYATNLESGWVDKAILARNLEITQSISEGYFLTINSSNQQVWNKWTNSFDGCKMSLMSTLEVSASGEVIIPWTQEINNLYNVWNVSNPTRLVIPNNVKMIEIYCNIVCDTNNEGYRGMSILKNSVGLLECPVIRQNAIQDNITTLSFTSCLIPVSEGDYFEVIFNHNSTTDVILRDNTFICIKFI